MLTTEMMQSTFARRATAAAVMNRPCLSVLTKSLVIWHYDCAAAARGGSNTQCYLRAAPLSPVTTTSGSVYTPSFRSYKSQTAKRYFNHKNKSDLGGFSAGYESDNEDLHKPNKAIGLQYQVPQRIRQKVISASDAATLVRDGDTVCVTGFVSQGSPEAVLKALGERFDSSGSPNQLTLIFGGGPGDWDTKGLGHLARTSPEGSDKPSMLRRTIGGHYGQVPKVVELALKNEVEAWTLPLGSISRMIRSQSTHSPGHITSVGLGTYVDPDISGGAANEAARRSPLHPKLVQKIKIDDQDNLMYKSLPIDVAIIRGTTADSMGNISLEQETLLCDQKITAAAAKNSGGIVIAQVKRLAANGTLPSRSVDVPAPLVDCIVVVDGKDQDELHPMSFEERENPALTGELITPNDELEAMPLDLRKIIARRAFFSLKPNTTVNLGIGLPEGVASVAAEEEMLDYLTLSTEPGIFGGLPASGRSFGPAFNAASVIEMNQMFDYYDGGGLDMCFLGAAQVSKNGDVNVSRMNSNRITGPGGFIDISQSTRNICFMTPLTAKGLEISTPGDGTLKIEQEGKIKKFVNKVFETTFSGSEAVRRGQQVYYVTERAVFKRTAKYDVLQLIEIAPGVDLQKDILDQMEFVPEISPDLIEMDSRIFRPGKMGVTSEMFGTLEERCTYHSQDNTLFIDLFGITLNTEEDVEWFGRGLKSIMAPIVLERGKIHVIAQYDGFDLRKGLETKYSELTAQLEKDFYASVKRYSGASFHRAKLGQLLRMRDWDPEKLYLELDEDKSGQVSTAEFRKGIMDKFSIHLTPHQISKFKRDEGDDFVDHDLFIEGIEKVLKSES